MAYLDRAALLAQCKLYAQRPTADAQMSDTIWYDLLAQSQAALIGKLASSFPAHFYTAPTKLTTADSGVTYTFGTDAAGDTVAPFGHVEVFARESGRSYFASTYDGFDYGSFVIEGDHIRMPRDKARVFASGPYARFVAEPGVIDLTHDVDTRLKPKQFRQMLVWDALTRWCSIGQLRDPRTYQEWYAREYESAVMTLATQYTTQGTPSFGASWWESWWQTDFSSMGGT